MVKVKGGETGIFTSSPCFGRPPSMFLRVQYPNLERPKMNLSVPKDHMSAMDGLTVEITDEDIDDVVGEVRFQKGTGRHISLFGRYKGTVQSHDECVAFVKGVQTVLEYMIG